MMGSVVQDSDRRSDAVGECRTGVRFTLQHAITVDPASASHSDADADAWTTRSWDLAHRWATGGVFPNFGDPELVDPAAAYYGANFARLSAIKARYDPDGALGVSMTP